MTRAHLLTLLAAAPLAGAGRASAHFLFVLPAAGSDPVRVVLSDTPAVDPAAEVGPAVALTLDSGGPARVIAAAGGPGFVTATGVPTGAAVSAAAAPEFTGTSYAAPTLVVRTARHQPAPSETAVAAAGLAVAARPAAGGVAFAVTLDGKPAAARVTVYAPGEKRPLTVEAGADGRTRAFPQKGAFAARAATVEAVAGEYKGHVYQQVRRYATLTTTVGE